jgi:hypothetical protein
VRRNILDRSLSQSFADEHKKLKEKYAASSQLEEEEEEREKDGELSREEKMEQDNELSNRTRNEVYYPPPPPKEYTHSYTSLHWCHWLAKL